MQSQSVIYQKSAQAGQTDYPYRMHLREVYQQERHRTDEYAECIVGEVLAVHQQEGRRGDKPDDYRTKPGENTFITSESLCRCMKWLA